MKRQLQQAAGIQRLSCRASWIHRRALTHKLDQSSVDDAATADPKLAEGILRAPFQKVGFYPYSPLFPWRHSEEILPRLDPKSEDYARQGQLLGGNIVSTSPKVDAYGAAYIFMGVPWYKLMFFNAWQDDLAESMSWAFGRGVAGILSNTYRAPMDTVIKGDSDISFKFGMGDDGDSSGNSTSGESLSFMVEDKLRSLYESAHEFGKDQIQVRLECKPVSGNIYSLFSFPFLSRGNLKRDRQLKRKYEELIHYMVDSPREAMPIYHEFITDMHQRGHTESTVICQVLVACDEIFWVKDLRSGKVVQGYEDEKVRRVHHLVRMEMVVETRPATGGWIPFKNTAGNWQITDIDDLLEAIRKGTSRSLPTAGSTIRFSNEASEASELKREAPPPEAPVVSEDLTNKIVFPWRHDEGKLARLIVGTEEEAKKGNLVYQTGKNPRQANATLDALATAYMFLDVPLYQLLFFATWKDDLAQSMSWAFTQGVAGLLSNLSSDPVDDIVEDTYRVNFWRTLGEEDTKGGADSSLPLPGIMDENLVAFFQTAKDNLTTDTEVCLQMSPYYAEIVSLYAVPYISRRNAKTDLGLLNHYKEMLRKPNVERAPFLDKLRREQLRAGTMESTVIAQVLVWCSEVFYVKDTKNGEIVQGVGDAETRNVPHLLRMEMTVNSKMDSKLSFRNTQHNWVITDIDDLLEGNLIV